MLVFIDESGDPGFKVDKGASPVFVAAMVIFADATDATRTQAVIEGVRAKRVHKPEFKFNKCRNEVRDMFFEAVRVCPFKVRAIVVRKEVITSARLKADKDKFYEYFVKAMMAFDNGVLVDAKVIIDGSGDREFRRNLAAALRRRLAPGSLKSMRFKDSANDPLVQLADMCAGAIARSCRDDRSKNNRWRKMLAPRINDVWDFK